MQHLISEYSCNQISQTSRSFYSLLKENIKYKTEYCEEELEAREYKHVMFYSLQSYQSYSAVWWSWNSGPDCTIGARLSHPTNSHTLRLSRTQLLLISNNFEDYFKTLFHIIHISMIRIYLSLQTILGHISHIIC